MFLVLRGSVVFREFYTYARFAVIDIELRSSRLSFEIHRNRKIITFENRLPIYILILFTFTYYNFKRRFRYTHE